jgi:hypothetical protein
MNGAAWTVAVALGALVAAGCATGTRGTGGDAGTGMCTSDTDCIDTLECTVDSCGVSGVCENMAIDALCMPGESCVAGRGCVMGMSCDDSSDCNDMIECTTDSCGVGGTCRFMPLDALCTDPATPTCDVMMGCIAGSGCSMDSQCDDMIGCTDDFCGAGATCEHTPLNALCTGAGEICSVARGCYVPMPCDTDAECQDDNFCNGMEFCDDEFGCAPAMTPRVCNDSEDCTVDSCDMASDMCTFRCDPTRGAACMAMCPPPAAGCNGRFRNSGTTSFGCGAGGVSVDFTEATFENADGILTVTSRAFMTSPPVPGGLVLSDTMEPVCPMFDATALVSGGCDERYRIFGMFTDDDNFTGTIEWSYTGSDGLCEAICPSGSGAISGTRI